MKRHDLVKARAVLDVDPRAGVRPVLSSTAVSKYHRPASEHVLRQAIVQRRRDAALDQSLFRMGTVLPCIVDDFG